MILIPLLMSTGGRGSDPYMKTNRTAAAQTRPLLSNRCTTTWCDATIPLIKFSPFTYGFSFLSQARGLGHSSPEILFCTVSYTVTGVLEKCMQYDDICDSRPRYTKLTTWFYTFQVHNSPTTKFLYSGNRIAT